MGLLVYLYAMWSINLFLTFAHSRCSSFSAFGFCISLCDSLRMLVCLSSLILNGGLSLGLP